MVIHRIFNFSAGPAVLPLPVLEEAQRDLIALPGVGMSVTEISHRSKTFEALLTRAIEDFRELSGLPANYKVMLLQGGASLQFSMVPMNFLPKDGSADYVVTGAWSQAAVKEAKKVGGVNIAASTEDEHFTRIPRQDELKLDSNAAYLHFTSNNTIFGTQWATAPEPPKGVPLVCDMSSDAFSRPLDIARYGVIYAGAQKNLGPAGVTLVVMRKELLERVPAGLPSVLDYKLMAENRSLYNTPPCFAIYVTGLVLAWLREQGGLAAAGERNAAKASLVYEAIDGSDGFYRGHAQPGSRSAMNLTFRLKDAAAEKAFLAEAQAEGLDGLKGHRSVGGVRASLYNACPRESAAALASFMDEFRRRRG
jgi:phosphoserine aminotransferase